MKYDYNLFKNYLIFDGLGEDEINKFINLMKFEKVNFDRIGSNYVKLYLDTADDLFRN